MYLLLLLLFGLIWLGLWFALSSPLIAYAIALVFTASLAAMEGADRTR